MTATPNVLTPRQIAVTAIAEEIETLTRRLDDFRRNARDPDALFASQIIVFYRQAIWELQRAARFLELHDAADDDG